MGSEMCIRDSLGSLDVPMVVEISFVTSTGAEGNPPFSGLSIESVGSSDGDNEMDDSISEVPNTSARRPRLEESCRLGPGSVGGGEGKGVAVSSDKKKCATETESSGDDVHPMLEVEEKEGGTKVECVVLSVSKQHTTARLETESSGVDVHPMLEVDETGGGAKEECVASGSKQRSTAGLVASLYSNSGSSSKRRKKLCRGGKGVFVGNNTEFFKSVRGEYFPSLSEYTLFEFLVVDGLLPFGMKDFVAEERFRMVSCLVV